MMIRYFPVVLFAAMAASFLPSASSATASDASKADAIYEATGVQGGLVVHIGCGDGELTAALRVNSRYLVHGLDTDANCIAAARERLQAAGLYGPVSVDLFDGRRLPYVENSVDLVVASAVGQISMDELLRVLAPGAVAYLHTDSGWSKTVKPRPVDIDQWTHFLHDASGNAVAQDAQVGPPKRLHWVAGPRWNRSHEIPSSVQAIATAGGRLFTIFDEGPTGVYRGLPQKCSVIARDAFNGITLWKKPLQNWQPEFGTGTGNRWNIHHTIPRRLVVDENRVFVTMQFLDSPVSVLDAATGDVLVDALPGTRGTDEMILANGVLIVKKTKGRSVGATERVGKEMLNDSLAAIDVDTGKVLWKIDQTRVLPYMLCALDGKLVYYDMDDLICLDARTGEPIWRTARPVPSTLGAVSTLVLSDNVVLFHGPGKTASQTGRGKQKTTPLLTAYSLADGSLLWQRRGSRGQAAACTQPTDVFVTDGVVWCGGSTEGVGLHDGQVKQTLTLGQLISPGHHFRCFRSKATDRYLIWPKRGAEFVDLKQGQHMRNDWLRASCFTGVTPANGLFYVPSSQCFCYPGVLVSGFQAMSAKPAAPVQPAGEDQLLQGPAFGRVRGPGSAGTDPADWPMHRRDPQRSGATRMAISEQLQPCWSKELACRGSQAVIVGGRLWVAEKDAHRIRCLDAATGQDIWQYTAGGRIDSAPTIAGDLILFGCSDGAVYCLRATDGQLVWRFLAAPEDKRLVSFGQLESTWPVSGSVMVLDGVVYFAAGRSSFLDGGIIVYGLDAVTGHPRYHHVLEGPWPDVMHEQGAPFAMEGALPDLLVSDQNNNLYMRRIKFDRQLNRLPTIQESPLGELDMGANHLAATGGLLDDTGFDRLFWMYSHRWPGFYFAQQAPKSGQLVVFDDTTTYAVKYFYRRIQWSPAHFPGEHGYLLFADDNDNQPDLDERGQPSKAIEWLPKEAATDIHRRGGRGVEKGTGYIRTAPPKWQKMVPLRTRAMLLAGDRLFAAGVADQLDPEDPLAMFEGRGQARLQVFSATDGSLLASYDLPAEAAFDGLSAAGGRLYLATQDGRLLCWDTKPR